jgi:hypothetical protein
MKSRFILFIRAGVYYSEDTLTRKQHSLRTKDAAEARAILHSKNEAHRQPVLNLQIARTYLTATDPAVAKRTWQTAMDELTKTKIGNTHTLADGHPKVGRSDFWRSPVWQGFPLPQRCQVILYTVAAASVADCGFRIASRINCPSSDEINRW